MYYCNKPKIVFTAIPKTGTTSIAKYLKTHFNAIRYRKGKPHTIIIPEFLRQHYSFTVVRNPFDRMVSMWWHVSKRDGGTNQTLEAFLHTPRRHQEQHIFITKNRFDTIIKYEQLEDDFKQMPFYVSETALPWENATVGMLASKPARPPTNKLLTPKIRDIICTKFARDFEVCGYSTTYQENE